VALLRTASTRRILAADARILVETVRLLLRGEGLRF
jgi:hypothetical protein